MDWSDLVINGRIVGKQRNGDIIIRPDADCQEEVNKLIQRRRMLLTLDSFDPKKITRLQQMKANALIRDINLYSDNEPHDDAKRKIKMDFSYLKGLPIEPVFSLSNCSRSLATSFIQYLVEYCFENDIPFDRRELHLTYDIGRMMFLSGVHNRCFATQARRDDAVLHIHHVNAIGKGSRSKVDHRDRYYMILRAELHDEIHRIGYWAFCEKYHCGAVKFTDEQLLSMNLMSKKQMEERDADPDYEIRDWQLPELKVA